MKLLDTRFPKRDSPRTAPMLQLPPEHITTSYILRKEAKRRNEPTFAYAAMRFRVIIVAYA